jgi:two-component system cell cycle response regulator
MLPSILLVDDEEDMLYLLERILKQTYTVHQAGNGVQALQVLRTEAVQLVISDVMMPEMDGYALCSAIKSDVEHAHIPVILLTAKNTIQSKVEGLQLGADAYIEKPFSKEFLMAQISSLLANRKMMRDYFTNSPLVNIKSMAHSKADEHFLNTLNNAICNNLDDTGLDVDKLAAIMNMSRMTLYRKIKAVAHLSPAELINLTRLKKAAEMLASGEYRIYEVSDKAGFSSQSNFARNFQKQFNMTPSDYMHQTHGQVH